MPLTPVEIRHVQLPRRLFGYEDEAVESLLDEIRESFESVWRERADLREENERLEVEVARYREVELLLRNSLIAAERAADELRVQARREADVIVEEARVRALEITREAADERARVQAEIRRLKALEAEMRAGYRTFLLAALARIEEESGGGGAASGQGGNGALHSREPA